jgi:hypothetical protein
MRKSFVIFIFIAVYSNAIGQVEKMFIDNNFSYQVSRSHVRWLNLTTTGAKAQDTLNISIEVSNTGRYEYNPLAWHMVDSFLYAIEIVSLDDLFVRARLIRYTIPMAREKGEKLDFEQIRKTRKALNYVQILDSYLFSISERCIGLKKPVYFDILIDKEGIITIAILEIDKKTISFFSKSIALHEKEYSDKIPLYKWVDTWKTIDTFSTTIQSPFRILKQNGKYYVIDGNGTLLEAKGKKLEKVSNKRPGPIVLVFDKNANKNVQFLNIKPLINENKITTSNVKKFAKQLIDE